jgi:hypothetical protein
MWGAAVVVWGTALGLATGPAPLGADSAQSPSPTASANPATVFVEVTPSTAQADSLVGIRASCGDGNRRAATVESTAFSEIDVQPQDGLLTAVATVPATRRAGSYRVRLDCPNDRTATTTLHVVNDTEPSRGPATGFGGTAGGMDSSTLLIGGGLAAVAAGAVLGLLTLRRRRLS